MAEHGLDAIVARAPDNVLYLTNFWGMKGYDAVVFPREGEPTLLCLEASADDAARTAWTSDVRLVAGYDAADPRPPSVRTLDAGGRARRASTGPSVSSSRSARRPPIAWSASRRRSPRAGSTPSPTPSTRRRCSSRRARVKTDQEIERMRLANEIAAAAMDHVLGVIRPGTTEAQIAAEWLGFVHGEGTGWAGTVDLALGFSLVWSGPGIKTFTATTSRPVVEDEPTLFEIWVCADGYWADHTKNVVVGELTDRSTASSRPGCARSTTTSVAFCVPGASLAELDRRVRDGMRAARLRRPADASDLPRRRRAGARAAVRAPGRRRRGRRPGWCLQSSQDATGRAAAACASRTTSSSPTTAPRS